MADAKKSDSASSGQADDGGASQISEAFNKAQDKGFFGTSPDPTPRDHYTVGGVIADKPTPETDEKAKADALDPKKVLD